MKLSKELLLWILIVIPYAYLALIWNELPEQVATHFNYKGQADNYSGKTMLLFLPSGLPLLIYFLMLVIPYFDPKKKIDQMGPKYYSLRLILGVFFCILTTYLLYVSRVGTLENKNILLITLGAFVVVMGNYFQTIRPNYFIGIRTPWTLESEHVWKKTHKVGGRIWMAGGCLMIMLSFIPQMPIYFPLGILLIISVITILYSYIEFKRENNTSQETQ